MSDDIRTSVNFLALAHGQPLQFRRLVDALLGGSDTTTMTVHVDVKADPAPFEAAAAHWGGRVRFTATRFDVRWGGFAMVRAELALLREAILLAPSDHYFLLSGDAYPIVPIAELQRRLRPGQVYMNCWAMPDAARGKPESRLQYRFVAFRRHLSARAKLVNRALELLPPRDWAKALGGIAPAGGSQWWVLPHALAEATLDLLAREPRLERFFSTRRVPDEMFFQTAVAHLADMARFEPSLVFADWSRQSRPGSPAVLTDGDVDLVAAAARRFVVARKFDERASAGLCALLDERIASER